MSQEVRIPSYQKLSKRQHSLTDSPTSDEEIDQNTSLEQASSPFHPPDVAQMYQQNRKARPNKCGCQRLLIISTCILVVLSLLLVREYQIQQIQLIKSAQLLAQRGVSFEFHEDINSTILSPKLVHLLGLTQTHHLKTLQPKPRTPALKIEPLSKQLVSNQPTIWVFDNDFTKNNNSNIWSNLTHNLLQTMASKTGHRVVIVNQHNWRNYLQPSKVKKLNRFLQKKLNAFSDDSSGIDIETDQADQMKQHIVLLEILHQHGGIMLKSGVVVTEDFSWLENIHTDILCNNHQKKKKAQIIGFHSHRYSPQPTKQDLNSSHPSQQYMVRYPSLVPYFLKAEKYSDFLQDFLQTLYKLITAPSTYENLLEDIRRDIPALKGQLQLRKIYYICSQIVFRVREDESKGMALEHYNVATINENLGPKKLQFILGTDHQDKLLTHLSMITLEELQQQFGNLRFFTLFDPLSTLPSKLKSKLKKQEILQDSYIHIYLLQRQSHPSLFTVEIDPNPAINQKWEALPRKIWSFIPGKLSNSSLLTQLWVEHVHMRANQSGFIFILLNEDNIDRYVSIQQLQKIQGALRKGNNIYEDTKMRLISLVVMFELGGVWIDPLTILTENVNWVLQGYKDFKIWNRFGSLPRVLLPFHPNRGGPFNWTHSNRSNGSKQAWHLGYDCSFIACLPYTELLKNWLTSYLKNLDLTYVELQTQFTQSGIIDYIWIRRQNTQLLILDTLKHEIAIKQSKLTGETIATEAFGLRALNGLMGSLKMEDSFNFIFGTSHQNTFFWRYSQKDVQNIIGPLFYPIKLPFSTAVAVNQLLVQNSTWKNQIHKNSILYMNLLKTEHKIIKVNGKTVLQKNTIVKTKTNWPKLLWVYIEDEYNIKDQLQMRCLMKLTQIAQKSNYQVRIVNSNNYLVWIDPSRADYMQIYIEELNKRRNTEKSNLKDHYKNIRQRYILLNILYDHGGIMVNSNIILLEDFSWLNEIHNHPFASQGESIDPQVFGFYSPAYSSNKQKYDNQYLVKYPALEDFFLAAIPNSQFIGDIISNYMQIIQNLNFAKQNLNTKNSGQLRGNDPYYEIFFLSCQLAIQNKQEQLDKFNGKLAITHYGLVTLNTLLYPYKLPLYFESISSAITMRHLTDLPLAQLEKFTGPLRYLTVIPKAKQFGQIITQIEPQDSKYFMVDRCFIHTHFYVNEEKSNIIRQKPVEDGPEWNLPKKVWFYSGSMSSTSIIQKNLNSNINIVAKNSKFTSIGVNQQNIKQYIDEKDYEKIENILKKSQNAPHRSILYCLAVLKQNGGLFIGNNWLLNKGLEWITNIGKMDSKVIFNRIGSLPKTLLLYDNLKNDWTYNSSLNSLTSSSPLHSVDFIATEPKSQLLTSWLQKFLQLVQLNSDQLKAELSACGNFKNWKSVNDSSQLGSEALACILAKYEQSNPGKSSPQAFGIWSISQSLSANKLGKPFNFLSESTLSPYLWQYSKKDSEKIVGNLHPIIRITLSQIGELSSKLIQWGQNSWGVPDSILQQLQARLSVITAP